MNAAQPKNFKAAPQNVQVIAPVYAAPRISPLVEMIAGRAMLKQLAKERNEIDEIAKEEKPKPPARDNGEPFRITFDFIAANPGMTRTQIRTALNLHTRTIERHFIRLDKAGALVTNRSKKPFRFWIAEGVTVKDVAARTTISRIRAFIAKNPGLTGAQIRIGAEASQRTVHSALSREVLEGRAIRKADADGAYRYWVAS